MYIPPDFQVQDPEQALALIRAHPLGMLVHLHAGGLDANHIPWELETLAPEDGGTRLIGQWPGPTPWRSNCAMAMRCWWCSCAEHAYISPNWYPSKHDTHLLVPTWNYRVVHVHGHVRVHTDQRFLLRVLGELSRTQEHRYHEQMPDPAGPSGPQAHAARCLDGTAAARRRAGDCGGAAGGQVQAQPKPQ